MDFYYKEYAGKDVDIVLTTREFTRMLRETHIRPEVLTDRKPDSLMQEWTGAGVIFGATGGGNRISGALPERLLKQLADVHLLLPGLPAYSL